MTGNVFPGAPHELRRRRRRPLPQSDYITRAELLALVPLCRSTIDTLEKRGVFPSRFILAPTTRVAWKRAEVMKFLEGCAKQRRVHTAAAESNAAT